MADLILAAGRGMAAAVGLHKRHSLALAGLALHTLAHHSRAARRKEAHSLVAARHSLVVACHTSAGAHIVIVCCKYLADPWIHMYRDTGLSTAKTLQGESFRFCASPATPCLKSLVSRAQSASFYAGHVPVEIDIPPHWQWEQHRGGRLTGCWGGMWP